eukprot:292670_1
MPATKSRTKKTTKKKIQQQKSNHNNMNHNGDHNHNHNGHHNGYNNGDHHQHHTSPPNHNFIPKVPKPPKQSFTVQQQQYSNKLTTDPQFLGNRSPFYETVSRHCVMPICQKQLINFQFNLPKRYVDDIRRSLMTPNK